MFKKIGLKTVCIAFVIPILFIPFALSDELATVIYVFDGDTIRVLYHGGKVSVRLIGIDAPESKSNNRAYRQAFTHRIDVATIVAIGKRAKNYLKSLVKKGDTVRLEFDVEVRDKYGRLLAYVWKDGKMLNMEMICNGYAFLLTIPPNVKYAQNFRECFRKARKRRLGLWE